MEIITKNINEIIPYERNPRKNDDSAELVAESIRQFGFKVPIVIDKNNVIVTGHTRLKASKILGLQSVPCIMADDLSEEEIKAFRLADNKVSEASSWDFDLLDSELDEILDIDMTDFGFEFNFDNSEEEKEYYGDERERTFEAYNLYDVDHKRLSDKWQMPIIKKCNHIPKDFISFNYAKTSKDYEKGVHFCIDDYQFERIWNSPHDYIDKLKQFDCVVTPDFSLYLEMPLPMQMWNCYRSKLIGQIMQDYGIKVIPKLQWCRENSFDFCFDGIEKGGTKFVSTIGVKQSEESKNIWIAGMNEAIRQLEPETIIVYGGDIGYDFGTVNAIYIGNHNAERIKQNAKN